MACALQRSTQPNSKMKNLLHVLAIVFAAGIPCAIGAGFAGVAFPAVLGAGYLVLGFSLVLALQLLWHDYAAVVQTARGAGVDPPRGAGRKNSVAPRGLMRCA